MNNKKIKRKAAVALKYSPPKDRAPRVTAKGWGYIAERLLEVAKRHNIPIQEDPDLIQVLARIDIDQEIPPSVYKVVAEILAFVYSVNKKYKESLQ
ncbi:MAG: EscU/YscU/HrcU family type III secretion system export apparatus switch protein [Nitrospinota bacterium]|jgi:flagellar biosynthesis protein